MRIGVTADEVWQLIVKIDTVNNKKSVREHQRNIMREITGLNSAYRFEMIAQASSIQRLQIYTRLKQYEKAIQLVLLRANAPHQD